MVIAPSIHYTMGGLKMNNKGEILNSENKTIYGLFGAGEVTGGVHGGNRLGGNSLAECGVYGRISADSAVDYLLNKNNIINNNNISDNTNNNSSDNNNSSASNDSNKDTVGNINHFFIKDRSSRGLGAGGIIAIIIGIVIALVALVLGLLFSNMNRNKIQLNIHNPTTSFSNNQIIVPSK